MSIGTSYRQPDQLAAAVPPDPAARCRYAIRPGPDQYEGTLIVSVDGEVDLLTRQALTQTLIEAVSAASRRVIVDMTAMRFCCIRGYELLTQAAHVASGRGIEFAVCGLSAHQDRTLSGIEPDVPLTRHQTVTDALTVHRIEHTATTGDQWLADLAAELPLRLAALACEGVLTPSEVNTMLERVRTLTGTEPGSPTT